MKLKHNLLVRRDAYFGFQTYTLYVMCVFIYFPANHIGSSPKAIRYVKHTFSGDTLWYNQLYVPRLLSHFIHVVSVLPPYSCPRPSPHHPSPPLTKIPASLNGLGLGAPTLSRWTSLSAGYSMTMFAASPQRDPTSSASTFASCLSTSPHYPVLLIPINVPPPTPPLETAVPDVRHHS